MRARSKGQTQHLAGSADQERGLRSGLYQTGFGLPPARGQGRGERAEPGPAVPAGLCRTAAHRGQPGWGRSPSAG